MVNKITLIGRIGQIETKDTKSGDKLTNLSVATSDSYKDKSGEWQEKTQWHRCTLFKEFKADKGDTVYLEGKVEYRAILKEKNRLSSPKLHQHYPNPPMGKWWQ